MDIIIICYGQDCYDFVVRCVGKLFLSYFIFSKCLHKSFYITFRLSSFCFGQELRKVHLTYLYRIHRLIIGLQEKRAKFLSPFPPSPFLLESPDFQIVIFSINKFQTFCISHFFSMFYNF